MNFYPPKIEEKIKRAQNVEKMNDSNAVGTGASFECGTFIKFFLQIEKETKVITEAKFKTSACGFTIAAAAVLSERVKGRKLNELHGLDKNVLKNEIERELGLFSQSRAHCLEICIDALQSAFKKFRAAQIEEFAGEQALICTCFGVSEATIEKLVEEKSLASVEEITENCSAGGGCGACQPLVQEILDSYERARLRKQEFFRA